MSIHVLGELMIDGQPLSPRERAVLAALVLAADEGLDAGEVAEAVWRQARPATWPKQLQASIGLVRQQLGAGAIATKRGGYRLVVDRETIDADRFERLTADARRHLVADDPARAADLLERAIRLWRGRAYADLADWPRAIDEAARLDEVRRVADEDLIDARLRAGDSRAVVADAERLVRAEPLRERRWGLLALALYRSGRQAEALAALRAARTRLSDELGIDPGGELHELESAILRQDASLDVRPPAATSAECPYRGLAPYGTDDAEEFFGREDEVAGILARLRGERFLAISGPSGSGKSSVVLAGVVPALRANGRSVRALSGSSAETALFDALSHANGADVVIVDQFEELFHSGRSDESIVAFCSAIRAAVSEGMVTVVLVVRSDFLDDCLRQPDLGPLFADGVAFIRPITAEGLRRSVEEPARLAGLRLEAGLVEIVLRDAAGESGALPHVSHALVETWRRREGATLTVDGYTAAGGISGAIAQSADRLYLDLDPQQRELCRSILLRLVALAPDGAPLRRRLGTRGVHDDSAREAIVSRLASARLVSADQESLVIAHEALATAWPRLHGWLEEDADGARTLGALAVAADTWDADGRPDDELYRGGRLQTATEWRDADRPELTDIERDFLTASTAAAEGEAEALLRRSEEDRRQNRRLRVLFGTSAVLLVVSVVAGTLVGVAAQESANQRSEAQLEALVSTSLALRDTERDVSALLAAEAYQRWPDEPRVRGALMGVMSGAPGLLGLDYVADANALSGMMIPGTREAVILTDTERVAVYDVDSGEVVRNLDVPHSGTIDTRAGPVVSADGTTVAMADQHFAEDFAWDGFDLAVADVATGERRIGPIRFDRLLGSIAISPDGSLVAILEITGAVSLFDTATGEVRTVTGLPTHEEVFDTDRAGTIGFTPEGALLYGAREDALFTIDPSRAVVDRVVGLPPGSANISMVVLGDDRVVVSGASGIASVDLSAAAVGWFVPFDTPGDKPCPWLAASVVMDTVYCGDMWGRIEERRLATGVPTGRHLDPQLGFVGRMAVTSDGLTLDVIGRGAPVISHWALDGSGPVTRIVARDASLADGYARTGSRLLIADRPEQVDGSEESTSFRTIDTESGAVQQLPAPAWGVGWASDDLVYGDFEQIGPESFGLVSIDDGQVVRRVSIPDDTGALMGRGDGRRLYTMTLGGDIRTFDTTTGEMDPPLLQVDGSVWTVTPNHDGSEVLVTYFGADADDDADYHTVLLDGHSGAVIRDGITGHFGTFLTSRGEIIAIAGSRIDRYDAATFERIGTLAGVAGGLDYAMPSADGRILAAYSLDGTVSLYDLTEGIRLGDPLPVGNVRSLPVALRSDGAELAVNLDAGIAVWDLDPAAQADAACAIAGRDLTEEEWNTYLSDFGEYRKTCGFDAPPSRPTFEG